MTRPSGHVAVIGGGIAGCAVAHALERRGWTATLIDRAGRLASGASGNRVGLVMPRLTADDSLAGRFHSRAFLTTIGWLAGAKADVGSSRCGVLNLAETDADTARFHKLAATKSLPPGDVVLVSTNEASQRAGLPIHRPGLWFPNGHWVDPVALCVRLAGASRCIPFTEVLAFHRDGSGWRVDGPSGPVAMADHVVIANAMDAMRWPVTAVAALRAVRGQVTVIASTAVSRRLRCIVTGDGYLTPAIEGAHVAGATFDRRPNLLWDEPQSADPNDDARNVNAAVSLLPSGFADALPSCLWGRASLRATTRDHLPVAGPVPDPSTLSDPHWIRLPGKIDPLSVPAVSGLWLMTGLGSRGLTTALWTAELVAAQIQGEAQGDRSMAAAIHPARFAVRDRR